MLHRDDLIFKYLNVQANDVNIGFFPNKFA